MKKHLMLASLLMMLTATAICQKKPPPYIRVPALNEYAKHDPSGLTIIPEGRYLKPIGKHIPVATWPHGLVLSPDEKTIFVASGNVGQLITDWNTANPKVETLPLTVPNPRRKSSGGAASFSLDGSLLYWSSGDSGHIYVFDVAQKTKLAEISLDVPINGRKFEDSYAMDIKMSADGKTLYVADVTNFRVVSIDTESRNVVGSVDTGRYPYALTLTGNQIYVANVGMFRYSAIPKPQDGKGDPRGITYPAFGFPSKEAMFGVDFEGRFVPGLGDPNAPEAFSVWGIDASDRANMRITRKIKTGLLVGQKADVGTAIGGSAPNFLVNHGNSMYVTNNNNDLVERIDLAKGKIAGHTRIIPSPLVAKLRGLNLMGMAISPDGKRLYVAEAGLNAIAVMDTASGKTIGHIPTAWYPYRLSITKDGKKLFAICFRGFGHGPHGIKDLPTNNPFLGLKGVLTVMDTPTDKELPDLTARVLAYNGLVDRSSERAKLGSPIMPSIPGQASKEIKYVVFITKENHTFDTIFDRIPGAKHDPSLLRWGLKQTIAAPGQPTLTDVGVMVNHNALARQFTVSDNFHMELEGSGVGHRWLVGVQPNNLCQMTYTLGWSFKSASTAPGRLYSFGSNGSISPEDYPEAGSMWEHLHRNKISFRNYGEGFEFAGVDEGVLEGRSGGRQVVNIPMSKVLWDNTCREFPIYNTNIPDQFRVDWFIEDFTKLYLKPGKPMPRFINIAICNDHGSELNAKRGYPYLASWMADNDLALGRLVEFLSNTPYWKNMAIFVTQDDSGGEPDHVDKQRSFVLGISPWIKRGYVSHRHTTIVSMHRTMYQLFGLSPLNLFDAIANDFSDFFTTKPDYTPYKCLPVDKRIFDPAKAKDPNDPNYEKARAAASLLRDAPHSIDRVEEIQRETGNR